jgi:hypothetical protein
MTTKILKQVAIIVVSVLLLYFTVDLNGCNPTDLKEEITVLHSHNDSLEHVINVQDQNIIELNAKDYELTEQLQEAKENVKVVKVEVEKKVEVVKKYDSLEIAKFYLQRYPNEFNSLDTLIPLNKLVLVSVASDLVQYDGAKEIIKLQDSSISIQDSKIKIKDSIITVMNGKEENYKGIITNKNTEIVVLNQVNKNLEKDNKKLKNKVKVVKVVGTIVLGGLIYTVLAK